MNPLKSLVKMSGLLIVLSALAACSAPAQTAASGQSAAEIETLLIQKEQEKWDHFATGTFAETAGMFADDFLNVSAGPTGTLRQNRTDALAALAQFPPMDGIELSDFVVVHPDDQTAVVSYIVTAPYGNEYVSSVWAFRGGEWTTVFYQGTGIPPAVADAPAEASAPTAANLAGLYIASRSDGGQDVLVLYPGGFYTADREATGEFGVTGLYEVTGDQITFTDDERTDIPVCSGDERSGTYQFTLDGTTLSLKKVNDGCVERLAYIVGRAWTK